MAKASFFLNTFECIKLKTFVSAIVLKAFVTVLGLWISILYLLWDSLLKRFEKLPLNNEGHKYYGTWIIAERKLCEKKKGVVREYSMFSAQQLKIVLISNKKHVFILAMQGKNVQGSTN